MLTSYITQANVYHYFTVVINCLIAEDTKENTNVADMDDMIKKKIYSSQRGIHVMTSNHKRIIHYYPYKTNSFPLCTQTQRGTPQGPKKVGKQWAYTVIIVRLRLSGFK